MTTNLKKNAGISLTQNEIEILEQIRKDAGLRSRSEVVSKALENLKNFWLKSA